MSLVLLNPPLSCLLKLDRLAYTYAYVYLQLYAKNQLRYRGLMKTENKDQSINLYLY